MFQEALEFTSDDLLGSSYIGFRDYSFLQIFCSYESNNLGANLVSFFDEKMV